MAAKDYRIPFCGRAKLCELIISCWTRGCVSLCHCYKQNCCSHPCTPCGYFPGRVYGHGIAGESTCILLRFSLKIFSKLLPIMGLSSIFTPWLTWASFLISLSALQGRGEINLKVSDLLTLVSKSPPKTGTLLPLPHGALRMRSTLLGISLQALPDTWPNPRVAFPVWAWALGRVHWARTKGEQNAPRQHWLRAALVGVVFRLILVPLFSSSAPPLALSSDLCSKHTSSLNLQV